MNGETEVVEVADRGIDDDYSDMREAFRNWAEENHYDVFEDTPNDGWVTASADYVEIRLDMYGNVEVARRVRINGEEGSLKFGDDGFFVEGYDGEETDVEEVVEQTKPRPDSYYHEAFIDDFMSAMRKGLSLPYVFDYMAVVYGNADPEILAARRGVKTGTVKYHVEEVSEVLEE